MKFMWKTFIQGHIDYGSQLWLPTQSGQMQKIEQLLKSFTYRITGMKEMTYWERLKSLKMNSQQRSLERYRIIYIWKMMENMVPNCGINWTEDEHRGRLCWVPKLVKKASSLIKTQRDQSLQVHGSKLFHLLPINIRNLKNIKIESLKKSLDLFLSDIKDQPMIGGLTPEPLEKYTGRHSNSLLEWIPHTYKSLRRGKMDPII